MEIDEVKRLIEKGIPGADVSVTGDGRHFEAIVVSAAFTGRTQVQQHQIVYRVLGPMMGSVIHALSMQTYTPEEWGQRQEFRVI